MVKHCQLVSVPHHYDSTAEIFMRFYCTTPPLTTDNMKWEKQQVMVTLEEVSGGSGSCKYF